MRPGAQGWCTGMTLRDGMGREVGAGFRMGNTCTPMADSCECMANCMAQYCKVIRLQLKKKRKEKNGLAMERVQVRSLVGNGILDATGQLSLYTETVRKNPK